MISFPSFSPFMATPSQCPCMQVQVRVCVPIPAGGRRFIFSANICLNRQRHFCPPPLLRMQPYYACRPPRCHASHATPGSRPRRRKRRRKQLKQRRQPSRPHAVRGNLCLGLLSLNPGDPWTSVPAVPRGLVCVVCVLLCHSGPIFQVVLY